MKGALIAIDGNWGHFKKPETNNNPLTHDFITKTALIGMMGAVLGIDRLQMKETFPILSADLCYGVQLHGAVKKESWAFKLRYASSLFEKRPVQMEFLKNPRFTIAIGLSNERSAATFNQFIESVEASEAKFTPVLGLHNCPANLGLVSQGELEADVGEFRTSGFITEAQRIIKIPDTPQFRIGIERIPTYQSDEGWNKPDKYVRVFYPAQGQEISANGPHFAFKDASKWVLI